MWISADGSAAEMVSPAKTAAQVNTESMEGKHLYKVSHNDFEVGKSIIHLTHLLVDATGTTCTFIHTNEQLRSF